MPKRTAPNVGRRLRAWRTSRDLTQEEIARRAGTSAKHVSEIENGHTDPSFSVIAKIVERGLETPLAAFFGTSAPRAVSDDLGELEAMFAGQSASMRKRALRVLRALVEE